MHITNWFVGCGRQWRSNSRADSSQRGVIFCFLIEEVDSELELSGRGGWAGPRDCFSQQIQQRNYRVEQHSEHFVGRKTTGDCKGKG